MNKATGDVRKQPDEPEKNENDGEDEKHNIVGSADMDSTPLTAHLDVSS
jgi:hypothetical protein